MTSARVATPPRDSGPAWQVARLFPRQGEWDDGDYLDLNRRTNHLVELSDGSIEVLDMPTRSHQRIVLYLYEGLTAFNRETRAGEVLVAPYPVRLWEGKFREPDIVFGSAARARRFEEDFADGADLVIEVVSDDRRRDLQTKRREYARAGIREYWIVDPRERRITVLKLLGRRYVVHGTFGPRERATSALLKGFGVAVAETFAAAGI